MKHVTLPQDLADYTAEGQRLLVVHAEDGWVEGVREGQYDFFTRLAPTLRAAGVATVVATLDTTMSDALLEQNHLHIIFGNRPRYGEKLMHVSPSYVWGFWYLDEVGININSTMRMRHFRPDGVDWGHAEWFYNGVANHMIAENMSRFEQPERVTSPLNPAQSVVFCQDIDDRWPREHFLTTEEMIRNAGRAAQGGTVYVKPHPYQRAETLEKIEEQANGDPNIILTDASVHDLIDASDVVITQNSAAGFEALLHKKKVITCARSDYHHATATARSEQELREMLRSGLPQFNDFPYEKYLYWFLSDHCVEPQRWDFAETVWDRIRDKAMI